MRLTARAVNAGFVFVVVFVFVPLRLRLLPVVVVVVAPGMVHTDFVPGRTEEMMAKAAMATPLKRAIEAEDVALAVISCVTHLTHTTGSIISVDAGRHL